MVYQNKPVIGVLAQEMSRKAIPDHIEGESFIAASYVKYLESAGADVLPIFIEYTEREIKDLFHCVNGILVPGGGASLLDSKYVANTRLLYDMAIKTNDDGDYFPVWGTCLGLEAFMVFHGGQSILDDADAIDLPLAPELTELAKESKMFRNAPKSLLDVATSSITYHYHRKCITTEAFNACPELISMYKILACNKDRNGKMFVSAVEGRKYPIYGVQWHPERVLFENVKELQIPRNSAAVQASEYLAHFFVGEARKNNHNFLSNEDRNSLLMKNYKPVFTGDLGRLEEAFVF